MPTTFHFLDDVDVWAPKVEPMAALRYE